MDRRRKVRKRKRMAYIDKEEVFETTAFSPDRDLLDAVEGSEYVKVSSILKSRPVFILPTTTGAALFEAVETGDKRMVQLLLGYDGNVHRKDSRGNTPLHFAAERGHLDIIRLLRQRGGSFQAQNYAGQTPLMRATKSACVTTIIEEFLSEHRINLDIQDEDGKSLLMLVTELCDFASMELLIIDERADLDLKDKEGKTAYDIAKAKGIEEEYTTIVEGRGTHSKSAMVRAINKNNPHLLRSFLHGFRKANRYDRNGYTPLLLALGVGGGTERMVNMEMVSLLLECGAEPDFADFRTNAKPLTCAAEKGHVEAIKLLLEHGAKLDCRTCEEGNTALMIAAAHGHADVVSFLLDKGMDPDFLNMSAESALILALKFGKTKVAKLLMKRGAKVDQKTYRIAVEYGQYRLFPVVTADMATPKVIQELLCVGIRQTNCDLIDYLIEHGANVNFTVKISYFALYLASGDTRMVKLLLDKGAKVNERNGPVGQTALFRAVELNNAEVVKTLISQGADANMDVVGTTALMKAISSGESCKKALVELLKGGVDANYCPPTCRTRETPLHLAVSSCYYFAIAELLDHGASVEVTDRAGCTPLIIAADKSVMAVQALLQHGAHVNSQCLNGSTALILAMKSRKTDIVEKLLKQEVDVNIRNNDGETALMIAVQKLSRDTVKQLLDCNADVNVMDARGCTILFHAVAHSMHRIDTVSLLLDKGADVNTADNEGCSPLILAAKKCSRLIMSLLIDYGAEVNRQDDYGSTPLIHAAGSDADITGEKVQFLLEKGADVNVQNCNGQDALIAATLTGNFEAVAALISAGANVHAVDRNNRTALSYAMTNFNLHLNSRLLSDRNSLCMKLLLNGGAKPEASVDTNVLFHKLITNNKKYLVQLFMSSGMSPPEIPFSTFEQNDIMVFSTNVMAALFQSPDALITPLMTAILTRASDISEFFVRNWVLAKQDTVLRSNKPLLEITAGLLQQRPQLNATLGEIIYAPWSLASLSFVAVSAVVGNCQDREERIRALPIPYILQQKLLFRNNNTVFRDDEITGIAHPRIVHPRLLGLDEQD